MVRLPVLFRHCLYRLTEELQQQAGVFKRNANELKNKMWWKNMKVGYVVMFTLYAPQYRLTSHSILLCYLQMRLIIAAIVLVILGVIIAIAVTVSGGGK